MKRILLNAVLITVTLLVFDSCRDDDGPVAVRRVALNKSVTVIPVGITERLTATVTPYDAANKNVTWSSNNINVAIVNSKGVVTGISEGTAAIMVASVDGGFTAECVVKVQPVAVPVTGVTLNKENTTVSIGATERLTATVAPENADNKSVTWSSSDTGIATVADDGTVTGVAAGTAIITVTADGGGFAATCAVKVEYGMGTVTSTGWTAPEMGSFEYSMTYVTQIAFEDVVSQNPKTELAAFAGAECRGLAKLVHDTTLDRWLVYLTVFGNTSGETVVLKAYNPDKLRIYEDCKTFTFGNNTSLGSASEILNCR